MLLILVFGTITTLAFAPASDEVELPIRIYPSDGRSAHVETVELQVNDPSGVDSLYVQAHQPFYTNGGWERGVADDGFDPEGAAEIRVNSTNSGDWVPVRDATVDCAWPESAYDCVAGIYHTIRFTIPVSRVQSGDNTIEFKFNGTKGVRSGYRVLGVGFMRGTDPNVQDFDPMVHGAHDSSQLVWEEIGQWSPPSGYDTQSHISKGAQIWSDTDRLVDVDGTDIRASCGSCHAKDGKDLKYFGYSNRVIVARSRAHGLSETEGKQIAAYIRSRSLRTEGGQSYEAPGRPWNPPYQPGPSGFGPEQGQGPDEANPVYWAAGAGLDWVLDHPREDPGTQRDMLAHLFPKGGDPAQGVAWHSDPASGHKELNWQHISTDATLNLRSMPLDIQFPDWNHWLPKIHPMDAVPNRFIGGEGQHWYQEELPDAIASGELGRVEKATRRMVAGLRNTDEVTNHPKPSGFSENQHALSQSSVRQWLAVKFWETFHGNHFQDDVDEAYCGGDRPWCEPLGWPGRQRIPFDIAGHISSPGGQQSSPWIYGNEAQEKTFSHIWYQLQMVINPGTQPRSSGQNPVDIGYQRGHIRHSEEMGPPADFRRFQTEIKVWQLHSKTGRVDIDNKEWNANISRTNFFDDVNPADPTLKRALHTAGMRAWWDQMRRHDISAFPREDDENPWYYTESAVPEPTGFTSNKNQGQQTYQYLIKSAEQGLLPASLIDSIGTEWGQPMWPKTGEPPYDDRPRWDEIAGDDDSNDGDGNSTPPVELSDFTVTLDGTAAILEWSTTSETNNAGFGVQHQSPEEDDFTDLTFVKSADTTDQPESYRARVEDLRSGTHQFRLRQVDTDGTTHTTDPVSVRVDVKRELALQAPTPHPVRQYTRLVFTVKKEGRATVTLYNVLGQRVRTLYDRAAAVGPEHELTLSTDDLSSGTYFVRLSAPSGTRTERLVVVK